MVTYSLVYEIIKTKCRPMGGGETMTGTRPLKMKSTVKIGQGAKDTKPANGEGIHGTQNCS